MENLLGVLMIMLGVVVVLLLLLTCVYVAISINIKRMERKERRMNNNLTTNGNIRQSNSATDVATITAVTASLDSGSSDGSGGISCSGTTSGSSCSGSGMF